MKAAFIRSEVLIGLRRNITMTLAVVVTVAVSLSLLGVALLCRAQVSTMKGYWYDKVQVSVFLTDDSTDAQRQAIHDRLAGDPVVDHVYFETNTEAYSHFREQFRGSPELIKEVTPDSLPASFRVKLHDARQYAKVREAVGDYAGVRQVTDQSGVLDKLFRLLGALQDVAYAAAATLLGVTVLLVFNAMRVAAHQRRREIAVQRLVGASRGFITTPFIIEAAIAGLGGAALGAGALAVVKEFVVDKILAPAFQFTTFIGWRDVWLTVPVLVVVGVGVSAAAAAVTVRRHLRD